MVTTTHTDDISNSAKYLLRIAAAGDWDTVSGLLFQAFLEDPESDQIEAEREVFEPDRTLLIEHDGEAVAATTALTRDLSIPGAVVPAAHVTSVSVAVTHRRRGLLRQLMTRQLHDVRAAGREPVAVLWASEGAIYQRYGYGLATVQARLSAETAQVRVHPHHVAAASVTLRQEVPAKVVDDLSRVFDRVLADQPGWSSRDDRWWRTVLADPKSRRDGWTALRALLAEGPDGVEGYALWRVKSKWSEGGPDGEVRVTELAATTPAAYVRLMDALLTVDLCRRTQISFASTDEPLFALVDEARRLRTQLSDGLWLRVVDVAAALRARRYSAPVDLVLDVTDGLLTDNTGRYQLRVAADGTATCERTTAAADLTCDVADLGAAYLGGTSLTALAAGGRVRATSQAVVHSAATAFGWPVRPYSTEVF